MSRSFIVVFRALIRMFAQPGSQSKANNAFKDGFAA